MISWRTRRGVLAGAFLAYLAFPGHAQDTRPPPASSGRVSDEVETLKERLSDKATDQQRVDNCKVPLDRRGPKPRPDACPAPSTAPQAPTQ